MKFVQKILLALSLTAITIIPVFIIPSPVYAADFELSINRTFTASSNKTKLHITEKRTIKSNSYTYYIPSTSKETFTIQNFKEGLETDELKIKKDSIKVTNAYAATMPYKIKEKNNEFTIEVDYPTSVNANQSLTFILEYDTNELIETVGKVTNIYIPGLDQDHKSTVRDSSNGTTTQVAYSTTLKVPKDYPDASFTLPKPSTTDTEGKYRIYKFSTKSLLGKSVWHQMGTDQIYKFKIVQPTSQTDFFTPEQLDFLSKNEYSMLFPREYDETNQKVFFTKITPDPYSVSIDKEGNIIADFYINATKDSEIIVEGYITTELNHKDEDGLVKKIPDSVTLDDLKEYSDMSKYLEESEYWEVDNPEIQKKAEELKGASNNVIQILESDYNFIVESIDYDDFKYGDRNERQGALATLKGSNSVCMEYSDLLIALARAQGIPARAAYGYGYDPKLPSDNQESHQWVQAWIPEYGWLSLDPTWGETGREFIGSDLDHALWYVAATHPNEPSPLEVTSANNNFDLEPSSTEFIAVDKIPEDTDLKTIEDITDKFDEEENNLPKPLADITHFIQTSIIGKALVIVGPLCGGILIISGGITIITKIAKKIRSKSKPRAATPTPQKIKL